MGVPRYNPDVILMLQRTMGVSKIGAIFIASAEMEGTKEDPSSGEVFGRQAYCHALSRRREGGQRTSFLTGEEINEADRVANELGIRLR